MEHDVYCITVYNQPQTRRSTAIKGHALEM